MNGSASAFVPMQQPGGYDEAAALEAAVAASLAAAPQQQQQAAAAAAAAAELSQNEIDDGWGTVQKKKKKKKSAVSTDSGPSAAGGQRVAVVMRGLPGHGKSTRVSERTADAARRGERSAVCSADDFFVELGRGTYAFDPSRIADAHASCKANFAGALQAGVELVVVDNTNTCLWEFQPYVQSAVRAYPTTWTISSKKMARITSGYGINVLPAHQMALITSGCVPCRSLLAIVWWSKSSGHPGRWSRP